MNALIEQGFVAILQAALPALHIRPATTAEILPGDLQALIVECPEVEAVAGPLHRATVKLHLGTPAFDHAESAHRTTARALSSALAPDGDLATTFHGTASSLYLCGLHQRSQSESIIDTTWRSTLELVAGISTEPPLG
jgi:hypothetical protein